MQKFAVICTTNGKSYQVLLTENEMRCVLDLIQQMQGGKIKLLDKPIESIEIVDNGTVDLE